MRLAPALSRLPGYPWLTPAEASKENRDDF